MKTYNKVILVIILLVVIVLLSLYFQYSTLELFENYPYHISVIAIFKNETMNLKIWLDHYLWQGIEHFYLIDNNSDDNPDSILQPYIEKGLVTLYKFPEKYKQKEHYRKVWELENIPSKTKWLVVADLDEFWYAPNSKMSTIIDNYGDYDVIYSNWYMFGSDGLEKHPSDIRKAITRRSPEQPNSTKWICQTKNVDVSNLGIHFFNNDENLNKKIENDKIHLNHYPIQSKEFFEKVKMTRGDVDASTHDNTRDWNYFNKYDENKTVIDTILKDMIDAENSN